ncbi:unnamed protein product [Adineta ricciae]|uniref:Uncharacterized protein n=1 Tax=Adineta ricciae TaxID=249248 RepID=A0A815AKL1_ADIRI|nr:unnamed protein product [Adineta ricciae]CAF1383481.1 unnamed protein product [Adineta ricciae]
MNSSIENTYPYYSYIPSCIAANSLALIIYILLIIWFIQSLYVKCNPRPIIIFIYVSHLVTFIELIFRGTLHIDILNTKVFYRITSSLISISPRLILLANYHCLIELRGKTRRRILDRTTDIMLPFGAISAAILLIIGNQFAFNSNRFHLSFALRQISAGLVLGLCLFFYIVWHFSVSHSRRLYILLLLTISSICVLIEAIYVQLMSIPSFFIILSKNELWYYLFHVIPVFVGLTTWSIFHPSRLLPPPENQVQHDQSGKELLPPLPSSLVD